jgi:hypothetical protein
MNELFLNSWVSAEIWNAQHDSNSYSWKWSFRYLISDGSLYVVVNWINDIHNGKNVNDYPIVFKVREICKYNKSKLDKG